MQATLERLRERRAERGDEGGFTLIELLIVIVILAILAAIVVFAVQSLSGTSAKASCESDLQTVDHAVQAYNAQNGTMPTSIANLLVADGAGTNPATGVNGDVPGPWLHNTPTNGNHYEIVVGSGTATGDPKYGNGTGAVQLAAGTIAVVAPVNGTNNGPVTYDPATTSTATACASVIS